MLDAEDAFWCVVLHLHTDKISSDTAHADANTPPHQIYKPQSAPHTLWSPHKLIQPAQANTVPEPHAPPAWNVTPWPAATVF